VLDALRAVPRHEFVPADQRALAYVDRALPIGHDQTISQPYVVAFMTQALAVEPGEKVLEIGTGSGYQAAVLAALGAEVFSIEIVEPLGRAAAVRLERLGYDVAVRIGDGYRGWPEQAPFDAIILTAAPPEVPSPLLDQLKPGGRMVLPEGEGFQQLVLVTKDADGSVMRRSLLDVRFVPMTGEARRR
jgi:protein-L-isoaspartate(D-aspartate) O-methyltransferase